MTTRVFKAIGKSAPGLLLLVVAVLLFFGVLPISRDAARGVVTVFSINPRDGTCYRPVKYKAIIEAQSVVEWADGSAPGESFPTTRGFEDCAVFDRKNWRCRRAELLYEMADGRLVVGDPGGPSLTSDREQVGRFRWWLHRLRNGRPLHNRNFRA